MASVGGTPAPQKSRAVWKAVRGLGLAVAAGAGPSFYDSTHAEFAGEIPSWGFIAAILAFTALGLPFVLSIQSVNPLSKAKWLGPSWTSNLFDLGQPLQPFHYAAWVFVTLGVSVAVYTLWIGARDLVFVMPLLIGLGLLIGVRLSMFVFRHKLAPEEQEKDVDDAA